MQELRANTEVIVPVGSFVDVADGFTPQIDITLGGDEAELIKHSSTIAVDISGATWAAVANCRGWYSLTLTASHTDTEGMLTVIVQDDSDCLPVIREYMVLSQAAWDSKYAAKDDGYLDVNIKAISDDTTAADNLESACDNYSVTRGLTGTAVPAVAADGAGGLPISDAGGLDLDAIKAKTDNLPSAIAKNVQLSNFPFLMVDSVDHFSPETGLTLTTQVSKDGGAFAATTNDASEIGSGVYKITLTQTEMNAGTVVFKATATGADQRTITILTDT